MHKVVLYVFIFVGAIVPISSDLHAQQLDMVIFGNEISELEHRVDQLNTTAGIGGLDESVQQWI